MATDAGVVTVISSLISGIIGVGVSTWYFYKLERHKLKLELARLYDMLQSPGKKNADDALIDFLKSVCKASGLTQATLNDMYLLKTFNARN